MKWTESDNNILVDLYPTTESSEIAKKLGVSLSRVYNRANFLGLKKERGFASRINKKRWQEGRMEGCRKGHYKKGNAPMNKGLKITEYMSPEAIEKHKKTRFKKGNLSHNYRPVGSQRIDKDGYIEVKIKDPNVWELKHRYIWSKHNGKIPKSYKVRFIDGDRGNFNINNLEIISEAELMNENTIHRYPQEVRELIKLQSKLNKKLNGTKQNARR